MEHRVHGWLVGGYATPVAGLFDRISSAPNDAFVQKSHSGDQNRKSEADVDFVFEIQPRDIAPGETAALQWSIKGATRITNQRGSGEQNCTKSGASKTVAERSKSDRPKTKRAFLYQSKRETEYKKGTGKMPKKTFTPEQIVGKLRQIEVLVSQGKTVPLACKDAGSRTRPTTVGGASTVACSWNRPRS